MQNGSNLASCILLPLESNRKEENFSWDFVFFFGGGVGLRLCNDIITRRLVTFLRGNELNMILPEFLKIYKKTKRKQFRRQLNGLRVTFRELFVILKNLYYMSCMTYERTCALMVRLI